MKHAIIALPILSALLVSAQVSPLPHTRGEISGTLLYPNGTPVSKGKVTLTGARPGANSTEISTETDRDGKFEFRNLRFTSYWFEPQKEDEGYGDGEAVSVEGGDKLANPVGVKLTAEEPTAHVVLKLGPQWGILTGTVEDLTTHQPVVALLRFAEELGSSKNNEPHYTHDYFKKETSGSFRVLIPPAMKLFLQVNAKGYKPWFYPDGLGTTVFLESRRVQQPLPLHMKSGEKKSLTIDMEPEARPDGVHP